MALDRPLQYSDLEAVGPGTPAGRYLRGFWHPVMRAQDLTAKHPKPLEILGEKFTIYRSEDGIARITNARCPHRGALMSLGWIEGNGIRCRFHGWRFDGSEPRSRLSPLTAPANATNSPMRTAPSARTSS